MRGLLQRTIRAERDKRDKKRRGEDRGSDQSFSLRCALSYGFRNYKWKKKGTIYPLYYRQESVSFPDTTMYLQREKNLQMKCTKYSWCKKRRKKKRETEKGRERRLLQKKTTTIKRQIMKSLESQNAEQILFKMSIFLIKNKSCKFPKAQSRYKFNYSISLLFI